MNHKSKTALFKCLDILPKQFGFYVYHQLQNLFSQQTLEFKIDSTKQSFETISKILFKNGFEIKNKSITELGSGWLPMLPYLFTFDAKAKSVATYDINKHYKISEIVTLNAIFSKIFAIPTNNFKGVFQLPNEIQYFPNTDICNADLKNTNLVVSRFVLEHISSENIKKIHNSLVEKLKSGSYILHLISPSDHRAYSDDTLSLYDFLKYSEEKWDTIQTKFDYHNRLRLPEYIELFQNDFDVVHIEFDSCKPGSEQHKKFKQLKINDMYKSYSEEELTAGSITILLKVR